MTGLPPSPRAVAITVARVAEATAWPRFRTAAAWQPADACAGTGSGPGSASDPGVGAAVAEGHGGRRAGAAAVDGWIRLDRMLADETTLDAWYRTELAATAGGHRDLAGALMVYRFAGAVAELVVASLLAQRRALPLHPGGLALRFGAAARLDELAVAAPAVAVLADDPAAGEPGTRTVRSPGELRSAAADGLEAVFAPLADAVRARSPFGRPGMWGTLADHLAEAAVRRARDRRGDVAAAWAEASALVDGLAARRPQLRSRPRRQEVSTDAGPATVVVKGTCCLIYKTAGPADPASGPVGPPGPADARRRIALAACTSCPLRTTEDRAARFAAWHARR